MKDVNVYVNREAFNAFDIVRTKNGDFFIDGMVVKKYKDLHWQTRVSFNFYVEKEGCKKLSLDIRQFKKK